MRRRFVTSTCACLLALAPAAVFAQTPPAQQTPPPAQPAAPAAPKLAFKAPSGLLLVQIKPDQTGVFEEMMSRLKAGAAKTEDAAAKQSIGGMKVFKASEAMAGNALYVVTIDPATPAAEYDFFQLLQKVMTPDELRAPETQELFKKYVGAFAAPYNQLNLTPVGGGA